MRVEKKLPPATLGAMPQFCAAKSESCPCLSWVKSRKPQTEHMFSGLPPKAAGRHWAAKGKVGQVLIWPARQKKSECELDHVGQDQSRVRSGSLEPRSSPQ
jgi:hypothetical protein